QPRCSGAFGNSGGQAAQRRHAGAVMSAAAKRHDSPSPEKVDEDTVATSDSMRCQVLVGLTIVAVFFGVFGGWAVTAPLNSAVAAQAVVKVEGNRKSVQHLEGGIV